MVKNFLLAIAMIISVVSALYADGVTALRPVAQSSRQALLRAIADNKFPVDSRHLVLGVIAPAVTETTYQRIPLGNVSAYPRWNFDKEFSVPDVSIRYDIQFAPKTSFSDEIESQNLFVPISELTTQQLAEALWLHRWSLANMGLQATDFQHTQALLNLGQRMCTLEGKNPLDFEFADPNRAKARDVERNLPSIKLIKHLLDPDFVPKSYQQLAAQLFATEKPAYPYYTELNDQTLPVPSEEEGLADLLDNMLLLALPDYMSACNNTGKSYDTFILTQEERNAAYQILNLRARAYYLPNNATPRAILNHFYNTLHSYILDASDLSGPGAAAFSFAMYPKTKLYTLVGRAIEGKIPVVRHVNGVRTLVNPEETHLIVLDALFSDEEPWDITDAYIVVTAFEALCAHANRNPQNVPHLKAMLKALHNNMQTKVSFQVEGLTDPYLIKYATYVNNFKQKVSANYPQWDDLIRSYHF